MNVTLQRSAHIPDNLSREFDFARRTVTRSSGHLFATSVERDRHRNATAERGEYQCVGIWTGVFSTGFERFISDKGVAARSSLRFAN